MYVAACSITAITHSKNLCFEPTKQKDLQAFSLRQKMMKRSCCSRHTAKSVTEAGVTFLAVSKKRLQLRISNYPKVLNCIQDNSLKTENKSPLGDERACTKEIHEWKQTYLFVAYGMFTLWNASVLVAKKTWSPNVKMTPLVIHETLRSNWNERDWEQARDESMFSRDGPNPQWKSCCEIASLFLSSMASSIVAVSREIALFPFFSFYFHRQKSSQQQLLIAVNIFIPRLSP